MIQDTGVLGNIVILNLILLKIKSFFDLHKDAGTIWIQLFGLLKSSNNRLDSTSWHLKPGERHTGSGRSPLMVRKQTELAKGDKTLQTVSSFCY